MWADFLVPRCRLHDKMKHLEKNTNIISKTQLKNLIFSSFLWRIEKVVISHTTKQMSLKISLNTFPQCFITPTLHSHLISIKHLLIPTIIFHNPSDCIQLDKARQTAPQKNKTKSRDISNTTLGSCISALPTRTCIPTCTQKDELSSLVP